MTYSKKCDRGKIFAWTGYFFQKFIIGFSSICGPLTKKMRGDRKEFKWNVGSDKSFNLLKQKVTK